MGKNKFYIGIDIGGSSIKAGLVCNKAVFGNIHEYKTPRSFDKFTDVIEDIVEEIQDGQDIPVGFGIPGLIDYKQNKIAFCPNLKFLSGMNLYEIFPKHKIAFGNDADMGLLGEIATNPLLENVNLARLTLGTGVGSAYYINKVGSWNINFAGEAGHLKIVPNGKKCGCGQKGCLEAYFSGKAILAEGKKQIDDHIDNVRQIFYLAKDNQRARAIINDASEKLGLGIANLVNILGIEKIILAGKISNAFDVFVDEVRTIAHKNIFANEIRGVQIEKSNLIDNAAIIGAATFVAQKF